MPIVKTPVSDSLGEALVSLVEQLVATEPFKVNGFDWAAQELSPIFGDGLKDQAAAVWD